MPGFEAPMVDMGATSIVSAAQQLFCAKWGKLPEQKAWQTAVDEWNSKRLWREDVRFDEVQQYLSETTRAALQLQQHIQRSEADLISWLNQLSPSAESVYHDTCNEDQASWQPGRDGVGCKALEN